MTMTPQDVLNYRVQHGLSRRQLAEKLNLTESKVWRIETKGTIFPQEHVLLERLQTPSTQPVLKTETVEPLPQSTPVHVVEPAPTFAPAYWLDLQRRALEVGDHELERVQLGPDANAGFRLISNSELQTFKDCRRKWWLGWYRGMKLKAESPVGVRAIGGRIHRALAQLYVPDGITPVDPRAALDYFIKDDWSKLVTFHGENAPKLLAVQKQFEQEADLERAMIEGYVQWLETTGADENLKVTASETYMEAELDVFRPVKIIGKLDVRVRRLSDGVHLFVDHKSVADFTRPRQTLKIDEQMLHYHLLEWLNLEDAEERCDGALYNMLRRVKRTAAAKPPFYDRAEARHNLYELDAFKRRLTSTVTDILEVEELLNDGVHHLDVVYPRPSPDCTWKCDFFAVCPMFDDGSRAEAMLNEYYRKGDPLDYYRAQDDTIAIGA